MSVGIIEFQAERLTQVLAARRLSQTQLATMVGVSPATISKWKSGQQAPEREALERLATVVNVTPEWFTRPVANMLSKPLFRSNASALATARAMLEKRMEWANDLICTLEEYVDFPELNIPERNFTNIDQISDSDIEEAAIECRKMWNLGSKMIPDLALAAESNGIILIREETGVAQIEGLSAWNTKTNRPIVLLAADKGNAFRSRFDLAHEIGHLVLHKNTKDELKPERYKLKESQAHKFAGALLLPAESFANEVRLPPTLDSLLLIKQRFIISVAATIMRGNALGFISDEEKQSLYKRLSSRWGVKAEPGDDIRVPEQPRLLKRTLELLVSAGIVTLSGLSDFIGLSNTDIEMLTYLPEGYLSGEKADVVHLARLKNDTSSPRDIIVRDDTNNVVNLFSK